ncbi:MAG: endonuclease MutS2 [Eubacteriales bacterium]
MNSRVLRTLEYHKIIEQLVEFATSEAGKTLCRNLLPQINLAIINKEQGETTAALTRLFQRGSLYFSGNHNIVPYTKSLGIGSTLSIFELLQISSLLECTKRVKEYGANEKIEEGICDCLDAYFAFLDPISLLHQEIKRCIASEEELYDDASSHLKHLRRQIQITNDKIHTQLNSMVNGSYRTYLQDPVITMRNNRYCIPVKAEYKNAVSGMIHDQSSSGSTLFIEPTAIVNLNNQIKELFLQEQEEIEVILKTLSGLCTVHMDALLENHRILTTLDFIFAKAYLAMEQNATMPLFNTDRHIHIRKGRHPLLDPKKVVPIDLHLGKDFDLLIVTGPNTGGKTVSLKTVGLFTLMGQSGLHIPALDRSSLSIFKEVYADIGDEQSIEQSLSTFSSHMTNIVTILKEADRNSLCLFDELGAGTDPIEGAALAISILTHLHEKTIRTMATTHYSELKIFALSTPNVENASCEFDVATLSPTYRLLIGVPGKSNAFAISSKLGLQDSIIEHAKKEIDTEQIGFEDLLSDLEQSRITIEQEQYEIAQYKERIQTLEEQLKNKKEKIDQSKERIIRNAEEEARTILQDAKNVADETIRNLQKYGSTTSMKELEATRSQVRNKIKDKTKKLATNSNHSSTIKPLKPSQLKLGDRVKIVSMGLSGTVNSLPDARGNLFVQCGIIRSQVSITDLILIQEDTLPSKGVKRTNSGGIKMSKSFSISPEINLLGNTVDEALASLDKYLDDAYLAHLPSARIVHGKGTGALRNAVHSYLKRCSIISKYRLGEFGEGDAGVTIVEFK